MIYVYDCENCGRFEYPQRFAADPLETCPYCGSHKIARLPIPVGVIYLASGFTKRAKERPYDD